MLIPQILLTGRCHEYTRYERASQDVVVLLVVHKNYKKVKIHSSIASHLSLTIAYQGALFYEVYGP